MIRTRSIWRAGLAIGLASLALTSTAGPAAADPPTNSSFETPLIPNGGVVAFPTGSGGIPGWTVAASSVDIQNSGGVVAPSADGDQHVDLAGTTPGGVLQQVFNTAANTGYTISWNFGATVAGCGVLTKTGTFSVQGAAVETMSVTGSFLNANWQTRSTTFAGTGGPVTLQFADTSVPATVCGLTIDNIVITENGAIPIVDPKVAGVALTLAVGGGLYLIHRKRTRDELDGALAA